MGRREPGTADPLRTLTHARLRIAQGDLHAARTLLRAILRERPDDAGASALLREIEGRAERPRPLLHDRPIAPPRGAAARSLAADFRRTLVPRRSSGAARRIRRLEAWLGRIARRP